ncbi:MAG: CUAEP/CCAEP-tail radical SAM (seleno)protein, partial [Chloroflexota bacterium]
HIAAARLVGISVPMHTALRLGERIARRIRALNPTAHILFYGHYAWLNAGYLFGEAPGASRAAATPPLADSVIGGEFEEPLLNLVRWIEAAPSRRRGGSDGPEGVWMAGRQASPWLRKIPFAVPAREDLPGPERYAGLRRDGHTVKAGYVEASRGCLHTCLHCPLTPVYGGRFFVVPPAVVIEDVRRQVRAGVEHITFGDPDFLNGPTHALHIARALHQEFPALTFDATIKIEHILERRGIFPELKALGCAFVVSAVESLSDTVLARLRKGHTRADVVEALAVLADAGIPMRPSLLSFTPWTTLADVLELLHFVERRRLVDHIDPVHYAIRLLVPPGSALLGEPDTTSWLGELDPSAYSYQWRHPDPRMDSLHGQISRIVERGEIDQADAFDTFTQVKHAAHRAAGIPPAPEIVRAPVDRWLPPKLTEAWFC